MYSSEPLGVNVPTAAAIVPGPPVATIYHPNSFWYQRVDGLTPAADSALYLENWLAQFNNPFGDVNTAFGPPNYVVPSGTTTYAVSHYGQGPSGTSSPDPALDNLLTAVPLIPGVTITNPYPGDTDQGIGIYSPSQDSTYDFWQFFNGSPPYRETNAFCIGTGGGTIPYGTPASQSQGIAVYPFGETATGLPYIACEMKAEEFLAGAINHVMPIAMQNSGGISWPANRGDGGPNAGPGINPYEGQRYRLDPTLNVASYPGLSNMAQIIFVAGQKYGWIITDTSGGITTFCSSPNAYINIGQANPWPYIMGPVFNSNTGIDYYGLGQEYKILNGMPWSSLQFFDPNFGAAPSHVQGQILADGNATAVSSTTLTLPATVGSGNIVMGCVAFQGSGTITISDNQGNSYTIVDTTTITGGSTTLYSFYCANITNAPQIITATKSSGTATYWRMLADEFTGYHTLDAHATNTASSANGNSYNTMTAGSITTSVQNDLVYSVLSFFNSGDATGAGYDQYILQASGVSESQQICSQVYTLNRGAGQVIQGAFTPFASVPYACSMMAFK